MSKTKIKILIGYHKPAPLFKSDILTPIHLGRAVAREVSKDGVISEADHRWMVDNMIGDNTGENISAKNRLYAELTALYWAWKNYDKLDNPDYVGLMHYRRLFNFSGDEKDHSYKGLLDSVIKKEILGQDMILSIPAGAWSNKSRKFVDQIYTQYSIEHSQKDIDLFCNVIRENYPQMSDALNTVLFSSSKISWYGIFVMKRQLFFEYVRFAFDVFNKLEKKINWESYCVNQQRVFGYLQEFLLNIFKEFKLNSTKIKLAYFPLYRVDNAIHKPLRYGIDIHVCFGTDEDYVQHTSVAMASILFNANALDRYHFHLLSSNLSLYSRYKLKQLRKIRGFKITYHKIPSKWLSPFKKIRIPTHISLSAYNRLLIPKLLPYEDKLIYLDSDLLVLRDLNEIMAVDIGENWIGGVEDINAPTLARALHLQDSKYINSGVLLMRPRALVEHDYYQLMMETIERNLENYHICDQDVLNDVFHDKIMLISYRFNLFHKYHKLLNAFRPSNAKDFEDSCNTPVIVHFVGPNKPWLANMHPYKKEYDKFLSLTSFGREQFREIKIWDKIDTPEYKALRFFNVPIASVRIKPWKITKKFLGFCYYKKIILTNQVIEYNFLKFRYNYFTQVVTPAPSLSNTDYLEKSMQVWRKFIGVYSKHGVSDTLVDLAREFIKVTNDSRMHLLYTSMLLENGQKDETINALNEYTKRFGDKDFDKKNNLANFAAEHGFYAYKNVSEGAEIFRTLERTSKSDFLKYLFYGKSVAIVGNGPSHIGKKCGKEIDCHDIVVRINNYSVAPEYCEDYGSKTDVWLVGCGGDDVLLRKDKYKAVVFGQDARYFWGFHSDFYRYFAIECKIPCIYIARDTIQQFQNGAKLAFTSTGANFIYLLSRILPDFQSVHFYGFNFCSAHPDNYASHYFREKQSLAERLARSQVHDFVREAAILSQLIRSKK